MLQKIHERIKGWIAWVIVALVSSTFVLWGVQYYLQSSGSDGVVAKVNGVPITQKQLSASVQQLQRQYMIKTGHATTDAQNKQLKEYALQNLIMNSVLVQAAHRAGFAVGTAQVNAFIMAMPQFQENGRFSAARYQQLLYANGLNPYLFAKQLSSELAQHQIESGIQDTAFVLPNELAQAENQTREQRSFDYAIIPAAQFAQAVVITDKMLADYYQQHRDTFQSPEKVSIEYIVLPAKQVNDKRVSQLSDAAYAHPTTLQAAAALFHLPIQTSPLFALQDGAQSQGILSNPKVIAGAFSDTVLKLGNNSDPIEQKDGSIVFLRVKQHEPSHILLFNDVKSHIEKTVRQERAVVAATLSANKIAAMINTHAPQNNFNNNLLWQTVVQKTRDTETIDKSIMAAAFALQKINTATTAVLKNGDAVIIKLNAIKTDSAPSTAKQLETIQKTLWSQIAATEYQIYLIAVRNTAKIKSVR